MKTGLCITKDGSHSAFSEVFGQHYHNPNGALSESLHVFFKTPGLEDAIKLGKRISVFETGFGTGLNLFILADFAQKYGNQNISFTSVEAFPLGIKEALDLNFPQFLDLPDIKDHIAVIFDTLNMGQDYRGRIGLIDVTIHQCLLNDLRLEKKFDFFLHDAFSPEVNKELWTPGVFTSLFEVASDNAVLATYCAATAARASMAKSGWFVARAAGALGKREMTVASKSEEMLANFKKIDDSRLINRWDKGDFRSISD